MLVVGSDGSLAGCEHSRVQLAPNLAIEEWVKGAGRRLRQQLERGVLPLPHCGGCADWFADDLFESAPPIREHGRRELRKGAPKPTAAVVKLPDDPEAQPLLAGALRQLLAVAQLTIESADPLVHPGVAYLVSRLRQRKQRPSLELRLRAVSDIASAKNRFRGLEVKAIELALDATDEALLTAAKALAATFGASLAVRFVFRPDNWFEFEPIARLCARHSVTVDLHLLDRGGLVPLQQLDLGDLALVESAIIDHWPEFSGASQVPSLAARAFDQLCLELRMLVRRRAESDAVATAVLRLPPLDHPWCSDAGMGARWRARLFGSGHMLPVRTWLAEVFRPDSAVLYPWLRALAHRAAAEQQTPELLAVLREIYQSAAEPKLQKEDAKFAQSVDLTPYGGPWSPRLGIAKPRQRERVFAGARLVPADDQPPTVTVLVPSFRHERFIGETLRSVLAQTHAAFRLLVVDDRSPDATVDRARAVIDPRIEVRTNEQNLGLGNSVLAALATIETPYVALLNSDDLLHPEHLQACLRELETDPAASLVVADLLLIDAAGGVLTPENASLVHDGKEIVDWVHWFERTRPRVDVPVERAFEELLRRNYLVTSSNLVARTKWLRAQAASLRSLKYCLDWQLFLQAALEQGLRHVRRSLIGYRLHGSNTVWFRDRRRDAYRVEVNRVVVEAIRHWTVTNSSGDSTLDAERLLALLANVAHNTEVDSMVMLLNALQDPLQLEKAIWDSDQAREFLRALSPSTSSSKQVLTSESAARRLAAWRDVAESERGIRRWLQGYSDQQEQTLLQLNREKQAFEARAHQLEVDKGVAEARTHQLGVEKGVAEERIGQLDEAKRAIEAKVTQLEAEGQQLREERAAMARAQEELGHQIEEAGLQLAELVRDLGGAEAERQALAVRLAEVEAELGRVRLEAAHRHAQQEELRLTLVAEGARLTAQLACSSTELLATQAALAAETQAHAAERTAHIGTSRQLLDRRSELLTTQQSREFRLGNTLWNRLPLGYLVRRGKKWTRRLRDIAGRLKLRLSAGGQDVARMVTASTRVWPVPRHSAIYQEIATLGGQGFQVHLFHWERASGGSPAEFRNLVPRRTCLQTVGEIQGRDFRYFAQRHPERLRSFLERVATASGVPVAQLEQEPIVLAGCTFARMAQLARADCLHSYFLHEQSFMAMQAAWLLELPRGITIQDAPDLAAHPWRLAPLQLELADLVVAASGRIRDQILAVGGSAVADKILVKPRSVDGAVFSPASEAAAAGRIEIACAMPAVPVAGLHELVAAIAEAARAGHRLRVHLMGGFDPSDLVAADYLAAVRTQIEGLGLGELFVWHGQCSRAETVDVLRRCRAFVAPYEEATGSEWRDVPTAVVEAMACGVPVVASATWAVPEAVTTGVEGLVLPTRTAAAFAAAILQLLQDPDLAQRLGAQARARFERQFDTKVVDASLADRVKSLLAERRRRGYGSAEVR
jgi:glycosyltransferase involved in cell wall biosynthesis